MVFLPDITAMVWALDSLNGEETPDRPGRRLSLRTTNGPRNGRSFLGFNRPGVMVKINGWDMIWFINLTQIDLNTCGNSTEICDNNGWLDNNPIIPGITKMGWFFEAPAILSQAVLGHGLQVGRDAKGRVKSSSSGVKVPWFWTIVWMIRWICGCWLRRGNSSHLFFMEHKLACLGTETRRSPRVT